jgi:hypothetical protein
LSPADLLLEVFTIKCEAAGFFSAALVIKRRRSLSLIMLFHTTSPILNKKSFMIAKQLLYQKVIFGIAKIM